MRTLFFLLTFGLYSGACGQFTISGRIIDDRTAEALAFVTVQADGDEKGTYTDIDGKFTLTLEHPTPFLFLSYVGYAPLRVPVNDAGPLHIRMKKSTLSLPEAVVQAGENPAHRIIREAIARKGENNPESEETYICESYNKLVFTANVDSALLADMADLSTLDTTDRKTVDFFRKQHLFMMESVSERKYLPGTGTRETVLATRVSGLQRAEFALLASEFQSFSFYEEEVKVMGTAYLSPLSKAAIGKYFYNIEDTTFSALDTVYIISYKPGKGKNFTGLSGLLYIHTGGYALQNVTAGPLDFSESLGIEIRQMYERVEGRRWFPVQLHTTIRMPGVKMNNHHLVGIGRSYLKNIRFGVEVDKKEVKNVAVMMDPLAAKQPTEYWVPHRTDTLSRKELSTYHTIDSLGRAENLDRKVKAYQALFTGRLPMGPVSLRLDRLISFNDYEGFRAGLGLETNERITERVIVGGYAAFGFKDKAWKYGADLRIRLSGIHAAWLEAAWYDDVRETGGYMEHFNARPLSPEGNYRYYLRWMDRTSIEEIALRFRLLNHYRFKFFVRTQERTAPGEYLHFRDLGSDVAFGTGTFGFTEAGVHLRLAYKEKFVETVGRRMSLGTPWPILHLTATRGVYTRQTDLPAFFRLEGRVEKDFRIRNAGVLKIRADGGLLPGDFSLIHLFNLRASGGDGFRVVSPMAFETMRVNEFAANRFAALHLRHNFGSLLFKTEKFSPELHLAYNAGIGALDYPESHSGFALRSPDKPFMEGGLEINKLLKSSLSALGVGVYFRHGPQAFPELRDNLAIKLSAAISF